MRKLSLDVEKLRVQSFAAGEVPSRTGTVHAMAPQTDPKVCPRTQNWWCSVGDFCAFTTEPWNPTCMEEA
jgi:hypothetical protein